MKAWRDLAKLPKELWILCFATLINRLGTMALPFLVLYLTRSLGFTPAFSGAMLGLYGAVGLLIAPLAGRLADRWGALFMMELSLLSSGIALLLYPLARSQIAVAALTVLFAATNEAFRPANLAITGELGTAENRKSAFALSRLAINLGMSVGPAVGGLLAGISFPSLFIVDGLTTLSALAILRFSSFHGTMTRRHQARGPSPAHASRGWILSPLFLDADLRVFLLGLIPVGIVFFQHEAAMPLYLVRDLGFSEATYGMLFALNTLLIIALEIPLNAATSHWPHRRSFILGSLLFAVGFGSLAFATTLLEVALTVAVWTFGEMILFPALSAHISDIAPEGRKGAYMGLYSMAFGVAFMLGPWAGTLVFERLGPTTLWLSLFAVGGLSALVLGGARVPADRA